MRLVIVVERTGPVMLTIAVLVHLIVFAEHTSQMYWFCQNSESCSGLDGSRPPNSGHDLFLYRFDFGKCFGFDLGKCFGASSQSNHWASHWLSYKIHCSLCHDPSRNGSLLLHRIKEDNTLNTNFFFLIFGQLMRHPLIEILYLSNLF